MLGEHESYVVQIDTEKHEIDERLATLEAKKSYYDEVYENIRELGDELYSRLERIFTPNLIFKIIWKIFT